MFSCPTTWLPNPVHYKCTSLSVCGEASGALLNSIWVLATEHTVRDWPPTAPLPPIANYKAARLIFVRGRQAVFVGFDGILHRWPRKTSRTSSAHSYQAIRLLSNVKTQRSHNATLHNSGSSHTNTQTHAHTGVSTASTSLHPSFLHQTHTNTHMITSCSSAPENRQSGRFPFYLFCQY